MGGDVQVTVILEPIHTRHVRGHTVGEGFDRVGEMVWPLLERAMDAAARSSSAALRTD